MELNQLPLLVRVKAARRHLGAALGPWGAGWPECRRHWCTAARKYLNAATVASMLTALFFTSSVVQRIVAAGNSFTDGKVTTTVGGKSVMPI